MKILPQPLMAAMEATVFYALILSASGELLNS